MSNFVIENGELTEYTGSGGDIAIPDGVVKISKYAFSRELFNITGIEIPNSVKSITEGAFSYCKNLMYITVSENNTKYSSQDGMLYDKGKTQLICVPQSFKDDVTLPNSVTKICKGAFWGCSCLRQIVIPDSVTCIGAESFAYCSALTSISIPDSVTSIGVQAFGDCESITSIILPNQLAKIADLTFENCTNLSSVYIGDKMEHICFGAFMDCNNLSGLYVSPENENYTTIDGVLYNKDVSALIYFPMAKNEEEYNIPHSVKSIGYGAFSGCINQIKLCIPSTVGEINACFITSDNRATVENLSKASFLKSAWRGVEYISDGFFPNEIFNNLKPEQKTVAVRCYLKNKERYSSSVQMEIEGYIKKQGTRFFQQYLSIGDIQALNSLLQIYFPSIKTIENAIKQYADNVEISAILLEFQNAHFNMQIEAEKKTRAMERAMMRSVPTLAELKEIWTIHSGPVYSGKKSNECTLRKYKGNEKHVVIPAVAGKKKVTVIEGCFCGSDVHSVEIPDSVTRIDWAFRNCSSLVNITIPNNVTDIGNCSFEGCSSLVNITIPDSVTTIGKGAFKGCSSLVNITIPDNVTSIGDGAFEGCSSLVNITIPNNVTGIGDCSFEGCSSLVNITIPDSVTTIGEGAFKGCSSIVNISIPDSVTSIDNGAFKGCSSLVNITIPNNVTGIGDCSFEGCSNLVNITIPDSVTSVGRSAFEGCEKIIQTENGVSYVNGWVVGCDTSATEVSLRKNTIAICDSAFSGCQTLTSVTIPDSVTSIGYSAFSGCTSLENVTIPDSLKRIEYFAFSGCSKLTSITVPGSVIKIGGWAFEGCSSLTSVTIPDSVTKIDYGVFKGCSNLLTIHAPEGSYAEKYTKENNIKFEPIEE